MEKQTRRELALKNLVPLCGQQNVTHGHTCGTRPSREYRSWEAMIRRCNNPNDAAYENYGGRGIEVCNRWQDFENFLEDMGPCPPDCQLERLDNNGNYEPSNCCWATPKQQARNRRSNRLLRCRGRKQCVAAWAEETDTPLQTIYTRLHRGWDEEEAIFGRDC